MGYPMVVILFSTLKSGQPLYRDFTVYTTSESLLICVCTQTSIIPCDKHVQVSHDEAHQNFLHAPDSVLHGFNPFIELRHQMMDYYVQ